MRIRFLAATALLTCFTSLAQAELVSYWPFEEFPDELSTPDVVSGYDLQLVTTGVFDSANHVDGKIGRAFEFFGGDTSLFARTHEEGDKLPINLQPEWTISMWSKVDGVGQNDLRLLSESNTTGNNDPLFNIGTANNGADGSLDIYIRNNQLSTPTVNHPHTTAHPFNGEWNHIGWTYADGMHNIYINGEYDSSYAMESFGVVDPPNIDTTSVGGILRAAPSHWVTGVIDEVAMWNEVLPGSAIAGLAAQATTPMEALEFEGTLPPFAVGGRGEVGSELVSGTRGNQVFGSVEGDPVAGLGQSWYAAGNPGSKAGIDAIVSGNDRAVPYFHADGTSWWTGNSTALEGIPAYPAQTEGVITGDNYTVKLEGEILIEESGLYRFADGIDDFTYLAIDADRSGVAGDSAEEVLINDNTWTSVLRDANGGGGGLGEVEITNVAEGGEWLPIEVNMAEGGGGDSGVVYWDYSTEDGVGGNEAFFPLDVADAIFDGFDAVEILIPDSHLRGPESPAPLLSGEVTGSVPSRESGWEIDVNPADGTADAFGLENPDADIYTTFLNVDGIEFHINALGEVSEGAAFQIFLADNIVGTPTIATEGWSFDPATGSITFGVPCCDFLEADFNQDGIVNFTDFLVLSTQFNQSVDPPGTPPDISGNGTVDFADFLVLSTQFNMTSAGAAAVPEPSAFALAGLAGLLAGFARRRRR